jgi:hypothetical protein
VVGFAEQRSLVRFDGSRAFERRIRSLGVLAVLGASLVLAPVAAATGLPLKPTSASSARHRAAGGLPSRSGTRRLPSA